MLDNIAKTKFGSGTKAQTVAPDLKILNITITKEGHLYSGEQDHKTFEVDFEIEGRCSDGKVSKGGGHASIFEESPGEYNLMLVDIMQGKLLTDIHPPFCSVAE